MADGHPHCAPETRYRIMFSRSCIISLPVVMIRVLAE
jgi:hypothetical protein